MKNICARKRARRGSNFDRRFMARVALQRILRAFIFIFACWLVSNASSEALPLNEEGVEYPVKLAFLYNFTNLQSLSSGPLTHTVLRTLLW